jgi:hypothetical protein
MKRGFTRAAIIQRADRTEKRAPDDKNKQGWSASEQVTGGKGLARKTASKERYRTR